MNKLLSLIKPTIITFNKKQYYLAKDLSDKLEFFNSSKKRQSNIVNELKKLAGDKESTRYYISLKKDNDQWVIAQEGHKTLFIGKNWFDRKVLNNYANNLLPDQIELKDNEKCKDEKGKTFQFDVYGEKSEDKLLLCLDSIGEAIESKDSVYKFQKAIKRTTYIENTHFKYFYSMDTNKQKIMKKIYLTHAGFIKYMTYSKNVNT